MSIIKQSYQEIMYKIYTKKTLLGILTHPSARPMPRAGHRGGRCLFLMPPCSNTGPTFVPIFLAEKLDLCLFKDLLP